MSGTVAQAQSLLDTINATLQTKIANIDISEVSTGILYDRTFPLANLQAFGFLQDGPPIFDVEIPESNTQHFYLALTDLNQTDFNNRYPDAEAVLNANLASTQSVNIGVINTDFHTFREDAVDIGALLIQGQDSLLFNNPNSNISPYEIYKNSFLAAPLRSYSGSKNIKFTFDDNFWTESAEHSIILLQADFGDGNGYRTVNKNQEIDILYDSYGKKQLRFKATFANTTTKTILVTFPIKNVSVITPPDMYIQSSQTCSFPVFGTFNSESHAFQGYNESQAYEGKGSYENFTRTTCLTKPVIVVEGYDPSDGNNHNALFNELNLSGLGTKLVVQGYDVITLNFEPRIINGKTVLGGTDYIERNAMVLVRLIEMVNTNKDSNAEPTKVIGFSMGGLVARYALRYMELNNIPHDVDLYVSVDSPHQGATIPSGVQHTVKLIDDLVPSFLNEEWANLEDQLNYPATKQMLKYHYSQKNTNAGHAYFTTFYNNLNAIGYPQNSRNIAVVNGSLTGLRINDFDQRYYEGEAHLFERFRNAKLKMNFTKNSGKTRVFHWRFKSVGLTIHSRHINLKTENTIGSLENTPSGYVELEYLDKDILNLTKYNLDWLVLGVKQKLNTEKFSFIPTKSALDFQGNTYLYQNINLDLVCSDNTPFDSYYSLPSVNEPHMHLNSEASDFIYQEVLGNHQYPNSSFVLPPGSYYSIDEGVHTELRLENYLPGREQYPSGPFDNVNVFHVTPIGSSSNNWSLFLDDNNAIEQWNSSGSHLYFKYSAHKTDAEFLFKYSFNDECDFPRNVTYYFKILEPENGLKSFDNFYTIYPVPADYKMKIVSRLNEIDNSKVKLYDFTGIEVGEVKFNNSSEIEINTSTLNNGLYFLKIIRDNDMLVKQVMVQH